MTGQRDPAKIRRAFRSKEMRSIFDEAIGLGWTPSIQGDGHVRMTAPDGTQRFTLSATSNGDPRSTRNAAAPLRRWRREQDQ